MHAESYEISEVTARAVEKAKRERRPILAAGTTVVRALEDAARKSAAHAGPQVAVSATRGASAQLSARIEPGRAEANLFLYPGQPFLIVDQLLTNFHLPSSTLLILVSAFAGRENLLRAYAHAVEANYRFYSYGDCMLIR